jgi:HPt (histidine-containing phosphotransfer) domain-containing protein
LALASTWRAWIDRVLDARAARRAHVDAATGLPDLLERLGVRYAARARRCGTPLSLDLDPGLETDLIGPVGALGEVLSGLIAHAIDHAPSGPVTLRVDVVADTPGQQVLHFAIDALTTPPDAWQTLRDRLATIGGTLWVEQHVAYRAIAEVRLIVPPAPPHVDVAALRNTLGSDAAMREVIAALGEALSIDVGHLERALTRGDVPALRQWLHRVSGALGMAEATGLAAMGVRLEQDVAVYQLADMELAVRRFAMDATRALAWLCEGRPPDPLI